jgi:hypothetical protein
MRQDAAEWCGPTALAMVLSYLGADSATVAGADSTHDSALRGALITDLAGYARRHGFDARVASLSTDSLVALVDSGIAPIVLYRRGLPGLAIGHYAVVVGWEPSRRRFVLHDGGAAPSRVDTRTLDRWWSAADRRALIVRRLP